MRIRKITVNNFKSLVAFRLDLAHFNCLIGMNGAGKSTVLQFIDFLAQQVRGNIEGWLSERNWQPKELKSQLIKKVNIDFSVELVDAAGRAVHWEATFNPAYSHCTRERLSVGTVKLEVSGGTLHISDHGTDRDGGRYKNEIRQNINGNIKFHYQGSILSQLRDVGAFKPFSEFKHFFQNVRSLELLSPEAMKQRTREPGATLGLGGQRLASFLYKMEPEALRALVSKLRQVYPQLRQLTPKALRSGWKTLEIAESFGRGQVVTEARHIADGIMRLIAILAELQSDDTLLLFDEIENGINPELVEFVLDALVAAEKQVLVTTHSPLILNYLEDSVAREGVLYLYKMRDGQTRSIRFFDIPSVAEKLTVMGPGEAYADTDLSELTAEIETVTEAV